MSFAVDYRRKQSHPWPQRPSRSTGKERDAETGLDYFGARYYGSNLGRFLTPDWANKPTAVPYAELGDPQSLNLYGYVRNNPLNRTDPDGHICIFGVLGNTCKTPLPPPPPAPPKVNQKAFLRSLGNQKVNKLTVNQVAQIVTNEQANVKPGNAGAAELDKAKAAEANAVMNADQRFGSNRDKRAGTEPSDVNKASEAQAEHDREVVQQAYYDRQVSGTDTAGGRVYMGNASAPIGSRPIGDGRQTTYVSFGPFAAPTDKNYIRIYNDPE